MGTDSSERFVVLNRLAEEFAERYRKGERPALQEYIDRHPELADDIRDYFPALAEIEQVKEDRQQAQAPEATGPLPPLERLGDYRILREIGHGGMGVVYEAEQLSLGRRVALKVLPRKLLVDARQKRRFEREARAAAKLHHTNIVPVFGVGEHEGLPYYAMQFIPGLGLDEVLDELKRLGANGKPPTVPAAADELGGAGREAAAAAVARSLLTGTFQPAGDGPDEGGPEGVTVDQPVGAPDATPVPASGSRLSDPLARSSSSVVFPGRSGSARTSAGRRPSYWQSVAQLGVQVADALEYAHKQGVVHRDIKPSNLLLDTHGTVWVTDFGLAKAEGAEDLTHTGDVLGTLRYMPPEAFEGHTDVRGDVYALGLTLYELLCLRPAFAESERHRLIKQVTTQEPPRLDRLNPPIPRDLVTVVHKAIEREPGRRYQTAAELAADLQRFLDDEPIRARRTGLYERAWRWCRRNPAVAGLTALLVLLLVGATGASVLAAAHFDRLARTEARAAANERAARHLAAEAHQQEVALRQQAEDAKQRLEASLKETEAQRQRAERNFAKARAAVDDSFTKVSESQLLQVPGMQPLRRELLQAALAFYQDFLKERADDPAVRAGLASAWLRVGDILGQLGDPGARKATEEALNLYTKLAEASPADVELQHGRAQCLFALGRYGEAIAIWQKLVRPGEPRFQHELADAYNGLALARERRGEKAQALADEKQCLAIRELLVRLNPDDPTAHHGLGGTLNNIGTLLDQPPERLAMYRRAAEHGEVAYTRMPHVLQHGEWLANQLSNCAGVERHLGNLGEALRLQRRAVEVLKRLARDNPAVPGLCGKLIIFYRALAQWQHEGNHPEEAERTLYLAREVMDRLPTDSPQDLLTLASVRADCAAFLGQHPGKLSPEAEAQRQRELDLAMDTLQKAVAVGFRDVNRLQRAAELAPLRERPAFRVLITQLETTLRDDGGGEPPAVLRQKLRTSEEALARQQQQAEADRANPHVQAELAASYYAEGLLRTRLGKLDEAAQSLDRALSLCQTLAQAAPANASYQAGLAAAHLARGELHAKAHQGTPEGPSRDERAKQAEADFLRAMELQPDDPRAWVARGRFRARLGQSDGAVADLTRAGELAPKDFQVWRERGRVYAGSGQVEKAVADFVRALELAPRPGSPWVADDMGVYDALVPWDEVFTRVVSLRPQDHVLWVARTRYHAQRGRWQQAADDLSRALQLGPNLVGGCFASAVVRLQLGDVEGYRQVCQETLTRFGKPGNSLIACHAALACLLRPDAVPDLAPVVRLAERAVAGTGSQPHYAELYVLTRALADYREGKPARVLERLKLLAPDPQGGVHETWIYLCRALAHYRLGQADAARQALAQAHALLERQWPHFERGERFGDDWREWLIAQTLGREAEALIEGKKIEPQP
jgi:serine/threonine protein kinase/tetratricopeptide (TPR) repeat protein